MKNFQINPEVAKVEFTTAFDIEQLEKLEWDFSEYYHNRSESMAEKAQYATYEAAVMGQVSEDAKTAVEFLDEATAAVKGEHLVMIRLRTEGQKTLTYFSLYNHESNETYGWEVSGDDEKTLEDVIALLNEGENYTQRTNDESENENGDYVPTFIEA